MKVKDLIEALQQAELHANVEFVGRLDRGHHNYINITSDEHDGVCVEVNTPSRIVLEVGYFTPEGN